MHVVIRRYTNAQPLVTAMREKSTEVEQLISAVSGFKSYYAIYAGDMATTITVCESKAGTDESMRAAADWVRQNVAAGAVSAPEVSEGDTYIHFSA